MTEDEHEAHRVREKAIKGEKKKRRRGRKWRKPLGLIWAGNGVEGGL